MKKFNPDNVDVQLVDKLITLQHCTVELILPNILAFLKAKVFMQDSPQEPQEVTGFCPLNMREVRAADSMHSGRLTAYNW